MKSKLSSGEREGATLHTFSRAIDSRALIFLRRGIEELLTRTDIRR